MPEVIVDTSPLQYLHQLGLLDLLPDFYRKVLIPESVVLEIAAGHALAKQAGRIVRLEPLLDRLEDLHFRLDGETRSSALKLAGELQR